MAVPLKLDVVQQKLLAADSFLRSGVKDQDRLTRFITDLTRYQKEISQRNGEINNYTDEAVKASVVLFANELPNIENAIKRLQKQQPQKASSKYSARKSGELVGHVLTGSALLYSLSVSEFAATAIATIAQGAKDLSKTLPQTLFEYATFKSNPTPAEAVSKGLIIAGGLLLVSKIYSALTAPPDRTN